MTPPASLRRPVVGDEPRDAPGAARAVRGGGVNGRRGAGRRLPFGADGGSLRSLPAGVVAAEAAVVVVVDPQVRLPILVAVVPAVPAAMAPVVVLPAAE